MIKLILWKKILLVLNIVLVSLIIKQNYSEAQVQRFYSFFVTLRSSDTHTRIRTGPGYKFPALLIYVRSDLALKVIKKFRDWYQIQDEEGNIGWIKYTEVSKKRRYFVVKFRGKSYLYKNPNNKNSIVALMEQNVRGKLLSCQQNWCLVQIKEQVGWIKKPNIWGATLNETF